MEKKNKIMELVKDLFSMDEVPTETVVETILETVVTVDGVELTIDEEGNVMIGEEVAPDGEYVISEEETLTVTDGKIVKEEIEDEVTEEVIEEEMSTEVLEEPTIDLIEEPILEEVVEEEVTEDTRFVELEDSIKSLIEKVQELEGKIKETDEKFSKFSKSPADEEVSIKKNTFSKRVTGNSAFEAYAKLIK